MKTMRSLKVEKVIADEIEKRQLMRFGHTKRMNADRWPRKNSRIHTVRKKTKRKTRKKLERRQRSNRNSFVTIIYLY